MIENKTLYDSSLTDFRKIIFCLPVVALSVIPVLGEPKALAVAILIQGACNVDGYWDFLKDGNIHRPLRNMLYVLISISVVAAVLGLLSLVAGYGYFDTSKVFGCIVTSFALLAVSFPAILLYTDLKLNAVKEKDRMSRANRKTESEEDEL